MATGTVTALLNYYKRVYPNGYAEPLYKQCRLLNRIKTNESAGGEDQVTVVKYSGTGGGSATFANAQANKSASKSARFVHQFVTDYSLFDLSGSAIRRSKGNKHALLKAFTLENDSARYEFARSMAKGLWGNGGGALGRIASGQGTKTITLTSASDVRNFEVGRTLAVSSDDGTPSSPAGVRTGTVVVESVDREAGTVSVTAATWDDAAGIPTVAANDYIFRDGDYGSKISGVPAWCPVATPTSSDSFKGVNRSVDPTRLSGIRYNGSGGNKRDTLLTASATAHQNAAMPTDCYMNPLDYAALAIELQASRRYKELKGVVGFEAMCVEGASGEINCIAEPDVPQGNAWLLDPDDWCLHSCGPVPHILSEDGVGSMLRMTDEDSYEARLGAEMFLECKNPGNQVIITW